MSSESGDNLLQSNSSDDVDSNDDDDDDLITFQFDSKTITLYYSQLSKYSQNVREKYLYTDILKYFPSELHEFSQKYNINSDNIIIFFQLLQHNFNLDENIVLTYDQCIDLFKISDFLKIDKLPKKIKKYINTMKSSDVNFVIQIILNELKTQKESNDCNIQINQRMEKFLASKIEECYKNDKFAILPVSIVFRIVEKNAKKQISCDSLYDFIKKSISKFCILFQFVDLKKLSNEKLCELCESFSNANETSKQYFSYLKCNLNLVQEINEKMKKLQEKLNETEAEREKLVNRVRELKSMNDQMQTQLKDSESAKEQMNQQIKQLHKQIIDFEAERENLVNSVRKLKSMNDRMKVQLKDSENAKEQMNQQIKQLHKQITDFEAERENLVNSVRELKSVNDRMKVQLKDSENAKEQMNQQIKQLHKKIEEEEKYIIYGSITAHVKNGLIFNADICLNERKYPLDTKKSKYIVSTSNAKELGFAAYEKGEPITSLTQKTVDFGAKAGKYYVRALVVNAIGKSVELLSNLVIISGSSINFEYEEKEAIIMLPKGMYKLEVWGASGGRATGARCTGKKTNGLGGLGGYSTGTLALSESCRFHIFVGGSGKTAESENGRETKGGFPDGGGTKTGHESSDTSVPGTGGGSTSIRVSSNSLYSRIIVAGGGGGAGGDYYDNHGGFGGGKDGGNCYDRSSILNQGCGTQISSSPGIGAGSNGVAGSFGKGADGLYSSGANSGGGGGGGWYGGGGGGYGGTTTCSSGGGGSGWVFTESSLNNWRNGDSKNANLFLLNEFYYLTKASTISGDSPFPNIKGNGTEVGHEGCGHAKITPI